MTPFAVTFLARKSSQGIVGSKINSRSCKMVFVPINFKTAAKMTNTSYENQDSDMKNLSTSFDNNSNNNLTSSIDSINNGNNQSLMLLVLGLVGAILFILISLIMIYLIRQLVRKCHRIQCHVCLEKVDKRTWETSHRPGTVIDANKGCSDYFY